MQFLLLAAVVATVGLSESIPIEPVSNAASRLWAAVAVMTTVPLFALGIARISTRALARSEPLDENWRRHLAGFQFLQRIHAVVWLSAAAVVLYGLDWIPMVRHVGRIDGLPLIDAAAIVSARSAERASSCSMPGTISACCWLRCRFY